MQIKPVGNYKKPKYPKNDLFILQPELLNRYVPDAWKSNTIVSAALTVFVLSGCNVSGMEKTNLNTTASPSIVTQKPSPSMVTDIKPTDIKAQVTSIPSATPPLPTPSPTPSSLIAPLFIHGDGRVSVGCAAVSPPVYISEDEARKIIEEEMRQANISFKQDKEIPEITIFKEKVENDKKVKEVKKLILDGYNDEYNLGYEYVSSNDYSEIDYKTAGPGESRSTGWTDDYTVSSENLRQKLQKYNKINAVIFYEPAVANNKERIYFKISDQFIDKLRANGVSEESITIVKTEGAKSYYDFSFGIYQLEYKYIIFLDKFIKNTQEKNIIKNLYNEEWNKILDKEMSEVTAISHNLLKAQVHDFIDWLKKTDILKKKNIGNT